MAKRKIETLERRLIEALSQARANPDASAPLSLRDQPTEIVFTALQPRKAEERVGAMEYLGTITPDIPEPGAGMGLGMGEMGPTAGENTLAALLGGSSPTPGPGGAPGPSPAPAGPMPTAPAPSPAPAPAPTAGGGSLDMDASAPMDDEQAIQDLLVMG